MILAVCPVPAQIEEGADSKHAVKKLNVSSSHGRSTYYVYAVPLAQGIHIRMRV